ncbi:MAG: KamA family radical SAM protein, partial [Bacteroidales bacterium]
MLYKNRPHRSIELWKNVSDKQWESAEWQLQNSIKNVNQLQKVIKLNHHQIKELERVVETLKQEGKEALRITPYYASLIQEDPFHPVLRKGEKSSSWIDPIFWQSVPTPANLLFPNTGLEGAMCEESRSFGAAYQRYPNRIALFVAENTSCAAYCVHCQRAKSLNQNTSISMEEINKGLFYIAYNKNIDEVLITGGDALRIHKQRLQYILEELSRIEHVRVIRIATRVPVVLPMAITDDLLKEIHEYANQHTTGLEKHVYFMTHINHHQEITENLFQAVKKIRKHGFSIRNQTVLLNHVNDDYQTLAETFRRMLWIGVHPYYLLQCHKERGITHFITPIQVGKIYMKHLQGWISGMAIPKYASNVEGGGGKILLMPSGHDTFNTGMTIEDKISGSFAAIHTWDHRTILHYEALGRASQEEYDEGMEMMNKFIGRKNVFRPNIIIIDQNGQAIKTTRKKKLPSFEKLKKTNS